MPWQMAPPLIIIGGCFTATGLLINGLDRLELGRNRRVRIDEFVHDMDRRDKMIAEMRKKEGKAS